MLITKDIDAAYQIFSGHLDQLSGREVVWHHQLHPDRYAVDCGAPESQPYDFSGQPLELLHRVTRAGAIMRRFIVIRDLDFEERSAYMPVWYRQMLEAGEELYIARLSKFVQFMAACLSPGHGILRGYVASTHTNIPVHGAWEIQPNARDASGIPTALRDIVYATPDTLKSIHLYQPPYNQPHEHTLAEWAVASRRACLAIGKRVVAITKTPSATPETSV